MAVIRKTKSKTATTSTKAKKPTSTAKNTKTAPASRSKTTTPTRTRAASSTATKTKRATTTTATRTRQPVKPTNPRTAKAAARGKVAPTKPRATASKVKEVAKPKGTPKTGPNREVDATTGFAIGTDSHLIAMELLKGGESRAEIIERCTKKLPPLSNRGTPKPVSNMVASVLGKMKDAGFTISSSWVLEPPTRASKAKATRAKNARRAAQE